MTLIQQILTFAAGAQQFPSPGGTGLVNKIYAQPLRTNTHPCVIGTSTVVNDGTGTGVMKELATPPAATVPLDELLIEDQGGDNRIEPDQFYAQGTTGEKLKVTYVIV